MPASMWLPLLVNVLGFYALLGFALLQSVRTEILVRERRTSWVKALITGGRPEPGAIAAEELDNEARAASAGLERPA